MSFQFENIVDIRYIFGDVLIEKPTSIGRHKKDLEAFYRMLKEQESCEHEYGKPVKTIYGFMGKQCNKCYYVAKLKKSDLKQTTSMD